MGWNKKIFLFVLFISATVSSFSQSAPLTYLIGFANKTGSPYSIFSPSAYLSQRSIERRSRYNIPVDATDLPVNPAYIDSLKNISGVTVICKSKWFNNATIMVTDTALLQQVRNLPFVLSIRCSHNHEISLVDPQEKTKVQMKRNTYWTEPQIDYGAAKNQVEMLNGQYLHQLGFDGEGMYIAVMDLGFREIDILPQYEHLRSEGKIIQGPDFVHRDGNVFNGGGLHGTLVMSCMAPNVEGEFIGTAPNATYYLFVTENDTSEFLVEEDYWIAAAEWADSAGVDVFNTSLGYTQFNDTSMNHTYADLDGNTTRITRGVDMAAKKGILSVNSAGNSGTGAWYYISAPADADSCLTVGAVQYNRQYAPFSSKGPSYDGRVKPNVAAQGDSVNLIWPGNVIIDGNGTSFAGPIMAGMAACLWQAFPNKTNMEIIHAIEYSASQYNSPDDFVGYGIPDMARAYAYLANSLYINDVNVRLLNNPFTDNFGLMFYASKNADITLQLYDMTGRLVTQKPFTVFAGVPNEQTLDVRDKLLRAGVYVLKIQVDDGWFSFKAVKQ